MRTLTRPELTAALTARQMLLERQSLAPGEAIRRLTPLQGQDPAAPYAHLDEAALTTELGAWLGEPRTNDEIRERIGEYEGVLRDNPCR